MEPKEHRVHVPTLPPPPLPQFCEIIKSAPSINYKYFHLFMKSTLSTENVSFCYVKYALLLGKLKKKKNFKVTFC